MKRFFLTLLILSSVNVFLISQPVKKVERIKEDEVPVVVRKAFENDFGKIPEDGTWTVNFTVVQEGGKSMAKPVSYTFRKGNKADKIEVRYSPDGKLDTAKGLKKINANS
ncbi:MAG TPA: hypothetical protein VK589_09045 [Chryseolinea sp.]|nr:hypothetical protein [Chryseolinea sp.]